VTDSIHTDRRLTAAGLLLLWHARGATGRRARPMRTLIGLVLVGWGAFHVVDQIAFHLLLDLHDIREGVANPALYNWTFFAIGLVLAGLGWLLLRDTGTPGRAGPAVGSRAG
jgi:uncharacterized membrane protein